MRFFAFLIAIAATLIQVPASACHSCAGWGETWGKRLDVAASPSEPMLEALIACDRQKCASECADYLASWDACEASGDPACLVDGFGADLTDCSYCQASAGAWTGIGCGPELQACSYDLTCCTPCDDWLENGGDGDNLCLQQSAPTSIDHSVDLSSCACSPAGCAAKCGAACIDNGVGWKYLDPGVASFKCALCLAAGPCAAQYQACSSDQ